MFHFSRSHAPQTTGANTSLQEKCVQQTTPIIRSSPSPAQHGDRDDHLRSSCGLPRLGELAEIGGRPAVRRLRWMLYTLISSIHSSAQRTVELASRKTGAVRFGPHFHPGSLQPNARTESRRQGIESIKESRQWAGPLDFEIFLEGFDWGERFANCIQDSGTQQQDGN